MKQPDESVLTRRFQILISYPQEGLNLINPENRFVQLLKLKLINKISFYTFKFHPNVKHMIRKIILRQNFKCGKSFSVQY